MEMIVLKHKTQTLITKMSHFSNEVMQCQRQRQKEIWRLLALVASEVLKCDCFCYTASHIGITKSYCNIMEELSHYISQVEQGNQE